MTGNDGHSVASAGEGKGRPSIVIIVGPTCAGKTELAIRLAQRFDGEIINADSLQVYRGLEIGTAKPSLQERQTIPHHLIDMVDPDQDYTASDFRADAGRAIEGIISRGRIPFVVGGTGLYIKALLKGLVDSPSGAGAVRQDLEEAGRTSGGELLLQRLAAVDPETAARLHPNDRVRIVRALEVFMLTGRPISSFRSDHDFGGDYYRYLKIGIAVEREELYRRIADRVDRMMADGLPDEVRSLLAQGFDPTLKPLRAIGYKEVTAFLAGRCPLDETVRLIKRDTRRYAKRQLTWFRQDKEINWVEYPDRFDTICNHVIDFFCQRGEDYAEDTI